MVLKFAPVTALGATQASVYLAAMVLFTLGSRLGRMSLR